MLKEDKNIIQVLFYTIVIGMFVLWCLNIISANGLTIVNTNNFSINKTVGTNEIIVFQIGNDKPFSFYNVTISSPYIKMTTIPEIASGALYNVTGIIFTNQSFNGSVFVEGVYAATIGTSNVTHDIVIDYITGMTPCDFTIIKGDTVRWFNLAQRIIDLKNSDTQELIKNFQINENYTQQFNNSGTLNYYASWLGDFIIIDECKLTILDDNGFVHNPEYDSKLNLFINVDYKPTILEKTFLQTNYTMKVFTTEEGVFLLKNTGNQVAKNILILGEWFEFTPNNFDLEPGYSKTISYKLKPNVVYTNDTAKLHQKVIYISGNFPTLNQLMDVYIEYADINSGNYTAKDSLFSLIEAYCVDNPNASFCGSEPKIIYVNNNGTQNLSEAQFKAIIDFFNRKFISVEEFTTWAKENYYIQTVALNQTNESVTNLKKDVEVMKTENIGTVSMLQFIIIGTAIIIVLGGGVYLFIVLRKQRIKKHLRTWE
jgi:hypothetical protein